MKKRVSVLLFTALLMASAAFMACSNGNTSPTTTTENSFSTSSVGTGKVIGLVIDNRGNPVEGATVTLGSKQVKTNSGGEYVFEDVSVNDLIGIGATPPVTNLSDTAFYLTAIKKDKDGKDLYLPAKSAAVYVSYIDQETEASKAYVEELNALVSEYSTLLKAYAAALEAGGAMNTDINVSAITDTAEMTNTKTVYSDANEVFKVIADAITSMKDNIKNRDFSREFCSDFAELTMIPLDASFAGSVKLNLTAKTENTTIISEKTYIPSFDQETGKSNVVVRATYLPNGAGTGANYHWDATLDETGRFKFEGLPSGVPVTFSIDSFVETIGSNVYVFSSESSDLIVENSQADDVFAKIDSTAGTPATVTLDTISGQKSAVFMLYAQNDKIWVTDTSVKDSTGAKLLDTKAPITFTFSKPMFKVDIVPVENADPYKTNLKDVDEKNVTLEWSADGKTATFKPNDGNWNTTGDVKFVLVGEAKDGATTILNSEFEAYFDTDIWIGLKVEGEATETIVKSFDDVDGLLALDAPIVLTFSKEMTEYVELDIKYKTTTGYASIPNLYNKEWTDKNTLKITPVTYWDIPAGNALLVSVKKAKAVDGTDTPKYWKLGVIEDDDGNALGLGVNFDNYVDVSLADASTASLEQFTITFSKALKAFDGKDDAFDTEVDITIVDSSDTAIDDFITEIDETKKIITVKAKDNVFATKGKYKITLSDNVVAVDGSQLFRKPGNKAEEEDKTFETDFAYKGFNLRPISIEIIPSLPSTAELSRGVQTILTTPDKVLKITFTKQIANSTIQICNDPDDNNNIVSAKNYVDTVNPKIVYIPLNEIKQVGAKDKEVKALVLKMANNVTAIDGTTIDEEPTDDNYEEWLGYAPAFNIYAAMTLEGSSLIKAVNTASDKKNYTTNNTIDIGDNITFTFSSKPDAVHYTLYIDDGNGTVNYVSEGKTGEANATIAFDTTDDKTVVINTSKLISNLDYADSDRVTTYYIDLAALNGGVQVFNTTNAFFPSSVDGTFEKDGISAIYKSTDDTDLSCGTVEVKVNPILLEGTNLIDTEKEEVLTVDPKEAVTFTFNKALTGYTAKYNLIKIEDPTGTPSTKTVVKEGNATISGSTVTVQSDKLVIDNDNANDDRTTGYEIVLTITNADDVVVFSTEATSFPADVEDSFEADLVSTSTNFAKAIVGTNGGIAVNVNPILLAGTNLIDTEEEEVLSVASKAAVTFDFNTALTGYTAKYSLLKIEDPTGTPAARTVVKEGNATISGSTVTVQSNKLVIDNDNADTDRITNYEIVLTITDANDVVVFSTASTNFPSDIPETFEADLVATNGNFASAIVGTNDGIKVNVKPILLAGTNLIDTDEEEIVDVEAKAAVTFTFDTALTGYTAEYDLLDATGSSVDSGDATISGSTVTVQNNKMIIDTANAPATTGLTQYEIVLTIKDADENVVFTTASNFPIDAEESLEEKMVTGGTYAALVGSNDGIKFNVKPITIEQIAALLEEGTTFGDANGNFSPKDPVLPGSAITIKFSSALPVGAKVEYEVFEMNSSSVLEALGGDNAEKSLPLLTTATDTITISSTDMAADVSADKFYYLLIRVKKGEEILFTTESNFFGAASDYEAALYNNGFVDTTNGKLKVKVVESKVITFANDDTSVTTTAADFLESFKSNIVLQFSHPVTGYKAVLYDDTNKVFTKAVNAATSFTALSSSSPVSVYDEWTEANEEYIYESTSSVSGNVITITPTNYFSANKTVNIAIFNGDNEFVDVKFDDDNDLAYTTAATWDVSGAIANATPKTPNTAPAQIGNGAAVEFEFDTAYSSVTNTLAKYTIYVKNAESDSYTESTAATEGLYESGVAAAALSGANGVTTYRLGRAPKTYVSTANLAADAFKYGGHVNVAIVKELDGVKTVYKAELSDGKASTLNITPASGSAITSLTQINTSDPTGFKTNTTGVALACESTNEAQNIDFVLNITSNEWIKTITATVSGNTNDSLGSGTDNATVATPEVEYSTSSNYVATITFDNAYWYIDDTISITVKDTSNNEVTYTVTIK